MSNLLLCFQCKVELLDNFLSRIQIRIQLYSISISLFSSSIVTFSLRYFPLPVPRFPLFSSTFTLSPIFLFFPYSCLHPVISYSNSLLFYLHKKKKKKNSFATPDIKCQLHCQSAFVENNSSKPVFFRAVS